MLLRSLSLTSICLITACGGGSGGEVNTTEAPITPTAKISSDNAALISALTLTQSTGRSIISLSKVLDSPPSNEDDLDPLPSDNGTLDCSLSGKVITTNNSPSNSSVDDTITVGFTYQKTYEDCKEGYDDFNETLSGVLLSTVTANPNGLTFKEKMLSNSPYSFSYETEFQDYLSNVFSNVDSTITNASKMFNGAFSTTTEIISDSDYRASISGDTFAYTINERIVAVTDFTHLAFLNPVSGTVEASLAGQITDSAVNGSYRYQTISDLEFTRDEDGTPLEMLAGEIIVEGDSSQLTLTVTGPDLLTITIDEDNNGSIDDEIIVNRLDLE